jgi:hypothetical protein
MKRLLLLLLLASCATVPKIVFDNGVSFSVELAQSKEEKARGLMFREELPLNQGMLFLFDNEASRSFWMKNTLIPLDMIFIDANMTVVEIKANVPPCKQDPCQSYPSKPAKFVLEINGGIAEVKGIKVGSTVTLR